MSASALTGGRPAVVVDTDVVSYLYKKDTRADLYRPHLVGCYALVSFMTLAELARWVEERNWGSRARAELQEFLTGFVVHYPDGSLCALWGVVTTAAKRAGKSIQQADAWIAATALMYGAPLITNNVADFLGVPDLVIRSARPTAR